MLYIKMKRFLLEFQRRIRNRAESEVRGNGDNRGGWEKGVEGRVSKRKEDGNEYNLIKRNKRFRLNILP
jgi:hypothetical protein